MQIHCVLNILLITPELGIIKTQKKSIYCILHFRESENRFFNANFRFYNSSLLENEIYASFYLISSSAKEMTLKLTYLFINFNLYNVGQEEQWNCLSSYKITNENQHKHSEMKIGAFGKRCIYLLLHEMRIEILIKLVGANFKTRK